ncbi:MerR family transcriptional regulator [Anaerorhabdus sp.]|uniref:MerR family transcriptional regulator n=1 Tax=Anaerorhabdus sp. TaxID=1872524 RepID=UPI002FCB6F37
MYSMKEVCKKTGMTYETLKYYCNEGLIPNVKRDDNNYRVFDDRDIAWIDSLSCLKQCGMSISEMKEYIQLCLKGESSIPERKIILDKKKELLERKLKEVNDSIQYINTKQQFYDDVLDGKIKYKSNLIITN